MYDDLDDAELDAKIIELRTKLEEAAGGGIAVIAGENRRKEFTRGNSGELKKLLDAATTEREKRRNGGRIPGRAIGVRYGL